jgi:hypothetical protein
MSGAGIGIDMSVATAALPKPRPSDVAMPELSGKKRGPRPKMEALKVHMELIKGKSPQRARRLAPAPREGTVPGKDVRSE